MIRVLFALLIGYAAWLLYRRWERSDPAPRQVTSPPPSEAPADGYVEYKSLIRTSNFGMLTLLRSLLEEAGIRHYSSQSSYLHLGEAQLFVERDRLEHAEAILGRLDTPAADDPT